MKVTTTKGKSINVKDDVVNKYMADFDITKDEAIRMYLEDEGFEDNAEVDEMTTKAKENKSVMHGESEKKDLRKVENKKPTKQVVKKVSDAKKELFTNIFENLAAIYGENVQVVKENKLMRVKIGDFFLKIDVIQQTEKTIAKENLRK